MQGPVTRGAEPFEAHLLSLDDVAFFESPYERHLGVVEAAGQAAVAAEKVGVALDVGAPVGKFIVPGSVLEVGAVDESGGGKGFEGAVDGDFVGALLVDVLGDLFLSEGAVGLDEHVEDGSPAVGVSQAHSVEHGGNVFLRGIVHHECVWVVCWCVCSGSQVQVLWWQLWPVPLIKSMGKTMSLIQQGSQTAKKSTARIPAAMAAVSSLCVFIIMWADEAQVLTRTWAAWGSLVSGAKNPSRMPAKAAGLTTYHSSMKPRCTPEGWWSVSCSCRCLVWPTVS